MAVDRKGGGWLYLIKMFENENIYKIGATKNPLVRRNTLFAIKGARPKIIFTQYTASLYPSERILHKQLANYKISDNRLTKHEYYKFSDERVKEIVLIISEFAPRQDISIPDLPKIPKNLFSIALRPITKARLIKCGYKGETHDHIISRLLDKSKQHTEVPQ